MDMMRMDPNGKNLACRNCLDRKSTAGKDMAVSKASSGKPLKEEMKEYFCKECKYSFKRASHLRVSNCPYCGAQKSLMIKGSTARIIADAAKMKDDYDFRRK